MVSNINKEAMEKIEKLSQVAKTVPDVLELLDDYVDILEGRKEVRAHDAKIRKTYNVINKLSNLVGRRYGQK